MIRIAKNHHRRNRKENLRDAGQILKQPEVQTTQPADPMTNLVDSAERGSPVMREAGSLFEENQQVWRRRSRRKRRSRNW